MKRTYGWSPSLPDFRDHKFKVSRAVKLPATIDMRPQCPPVYDQGQLGSCTAHAAAGAFEFDMMKQKEVAFTPSRLAIYYNERVMDGSVETDAGSYLRTAAKVLNKVGVCDEALWPYIESKFAVKPSAAAARAMPAHKAISYQAIDNTNVDAIRQALAQGNPVIFGFTVYESFESDAVARTGVVPLPKKTEQVLGGHAVMAVGYQHSKKRFIVRNSWGPGWGEAGFCFMPYSYLSNPNLSDDFWAISSVT